MALERGHDCTASVIEVLVEDIDRLAREVKDMKALPSVTKRCIGFIIDDEWSHSGARWPSAAMHQINLRLKLRHVPNRIVRHVETSNLGNGC